MDLLGDIVDLVSSGGHGSGSGIGLGNGVGNDNGGVRPGAIIIGDMGISELNSGFHENDRRTGHRSFDIHRDVSSNIDAFTICQSDNSGPAPTFYSRPMVTTDQQGNMAESFHLYTVDSSVSNSNHRFSTIPTPDLISQVQLQKEYASLSMNTMIAQANIFASGPATQFHQGNTNNNHSQRAKGSMMILREGWKRKYRVDIARYRDDGQGPMTGIFYWKGSTSPRAAIFGNKTYSTSLGSELKLVSTDHPGRVLAVWKNGDGQQTMGNLTIFEEVGFFEEGILTEIVASCLTVALFERNSSSGILDWLTK